LVSVIGSNQRQLLTQNFVLDSVISWIVPVAALEKIHEKTRTNTKPDPDMSGHRLLGEPAAASLEKLFSVLIE